MKRIYVEPGSAEIVEGRALLETFLGSCVGVALHDPKAGVGGLLHVLLPSGSERNQRERPYTYAASGIPALIEAMEKREADRRRIKAHLAGGASILGADSVPYPKIGERNLVACRTMLELYSIPILTDSTGGRSGQSMRFYLPEGRVEVQVSGGEEEELVERVASRQELEGLISSAVERLRPDSSVAIRALQLVGAREVDFPGLERLIRQDQILAATVLRLANSARYGLPRRISRISQAIAMLGLSTFRKILMEACVRNLFSSSMVGYRMEEGAFLRHAVVCAELAEKVAMLVGDVDGEEAYLAGLLHDIGKIVLERAVPEFFSLVRRMVAEKGIPFVAAEREVFGSDHAQVGAQVAVKWDLPAMYKEAIGEHHTPGGGEPSRTLVAVVHVANYICNTTGIGLGSDAMSNGPRREALQILRFDSSQIVELVEAVPEVVSRYV